jgi:membrane protein DedA with SNARE-associated domain
MLASVLDFVRIVIQDTILTLGYTGIALVMLAENVFPPIPSELVMPFAGWLARDGKFDMTLCIIAGTLGTVVGAVILYYIGMFADEPIIRRFVRAYGRYWFMDERDVDRTLETFRKHGDAVVFFGRVIPLVRSLISVPAGMNRMPMGRFLVFTTAGSAIWTAILTIGGWYLGENWQAIIGMVNQYERVFLVVLGLAIVAWVVRQIRASRSVQSHA